MNVSGCVLLSHTVPGAVPSALEGLASGFGMEAGRFPFAVTAETVSTLLLLLVRVWWVACLCVGSRIVDAGVQGFLGLVKLSAY